VALVTEDYPENKLDSSEVNESRKLIMRRILDLPEDRFGSAFTGTWKRNGAVIINCVNQQSVAWLKSQSVEFNIIDGYFACAGLPKGW